jgi:2-aminoethylphosphonate-pyruvate transaminase
MEALDRQLGGDPAITHVAAVHCETTSGILNPIAAIADIVRGHGRRLIVDAMSAFGAIALSIRNLPCDAVVASANKCLEGVPGVGFAVVNRRSLEAAAGNAHALTLDINAEWQANEANGQWRFTPPTHVLAAFHSALLQHEAEGGVAARGQRYRDNCRRLVEGMRRLGFRTLLDDDQQAPVIVTFHMPADPRFEFGAFYRCMARRGFVIYPGKLTVADSFRIGCIGQLYPEDLDAAVAAVAESLAELGVHRCTPAAA